MAKLVFILLTSLFAFSAKADIIKCSFTEPFYSTQYSMVQQSLTIERANGSTQVIRNVSFQIMGPGRFELWDRSRRVLMEMNLNYNGSDGMSDFSYPYSAVSTRTVSGFSDHYGGCTSNFLHKR